MNFLNMLKRIMQISCLFSAHAWLDWWTDGYGSTSRETAEVRKTQNMKQVDEGLVAMVSMMGGELSPSSNQIWII